MGGAIVKTEPPLEAVPVLRDDEATLIVARYILENPVRAGLVATPESYPFSGSEVYALGEILDAVGELPRSGRYD